MKAYLNVAVDMNSDDLNNQHVGKVYRYLHI